MTTTLPNRIIKYFVDTSNPSQSGFYFYEKAGTGGFVRLGSLADASRAGGNTFEIDSSTAENVIYNGLGGADTYVVRSNLDKNIEISDPHTGDDGSGNEAKNTIVFDSDVTVTSINQVTRLEEAGILRIELTLDTGAVITVNGPDVFQYVVGGAAALDFAEFIATYGASGIAPANRAPVIEIADFVSIDENADGSADPVPVGYFFASDADAGDSLTYTIVSAVDQNGGSVTGFEVDGAGLITYVGTGLDAETITSVALTVSASDGQESAQTSVAISVRNIDEGNARFVVTSDGDITAAAVGDVLTVGTISADPDGNDAFTYQWYCDGAEIADATGASYTIPEDYNRNSIYVVVRYTDGSGTNEVVTLSGILAPAPVDVIAPAVALGAGAVTSLAENTDTSARIKIADLVLADADNAAGLELVGRYARMFEIDGTVLYLKSGVHLDHEHTYRRDTLDVRVQLNEGTGMGVDVSVAVTNVDEGNASFVVISYGDINAPVAGDELLVGFRGNDPDGTGSAYTYQWYRDGAEIAGATGRSYIIPEDYDGNSIYVVVRYTDGSGDDETVTVSGIIAPVPTATVLDLADLDPTAGFRLVGEKHRDFSGQEVSSVGDINDDGYDDFAIGAYAADPSGEHSGATYVVFGKASGFSSTIELSELDGSDGFRIDGESVHDKSGSSISAGDVNDDGYNDIIIGAKHAEPDGGNFGRGHNNGSTYVVFGKASGFSDTIDLSDIVRLGGGVRIDGVNRGEYSGRSVTSGDVNNDGYDDIIIGAYGADPNGYSSGSTYVVFGKANGPNGLNGIMKLSELDGSDGFRIDGVNREDYSGRSVSAGDINGDTYDDVIIGASGADPNGIGSGSTYVVFGKASGFSRTMELSELDGSDGFRIDGENSYNLSGRSVSSAGDINGDTYDDIIISAPYVDLNGYNSGVTYVVFGKASGFSRTMELSELDGSDGFRINGENAEDYSGVSVSSAGDFNGDGYDDIIIGAPGAAPKGSNSGSSYVVFGKANGFSRTIELSELDASAGFRIDGEDFYDHSGISVSSAGDVNDDGYDDIIIGAEYGGRAEGHSYVIYGHATSGTDADENTDTAAPANIIVKYFVDTSNPSQSGFYFYEVAGEDNLVRLGRVHEGTLGGDDTFEIDSPTAENVIYNGLGGADTYVIRGRLDNDVQIHDVDYGADGSGNEVKNTIVFAGDVTVTSIYQDRLQGRADVIKIEQTLDTDAIVTVHVPDAFEYVVGGAAALDFAEFIATYGASGISATNRAPVFENEPTDLSINENADGSAVPVSVGRVVASDADAGDTLTYSIVSTADQNGDSVTGFEVDGTGLITYVGTGLDAETITSVALTVSASDGQESVQTSVAISVADLNDVAPTITSGATGNALTENAIVPNTQVIYTATGTSDVTDISWSLSGPDAGLFNIDRATGEVRFERETTPDHEGKDSYSFTVVATSGALASVEQSVTIAVTNVDEGNASFVITSDGDINAAVAGDVLTVGLRYSDPDGNGTFSYQWYRDGVDISGATGASYTITESDEGNSLYVAVRYTDGSGTDETVTASGIIVPVPVDVIAVELGAGAVTSLAENTDTSARIKIADLVLADADGVLADADNAAGLELVGRYARMFEIDGTVLYLKSGVRLHHEHTYRGDTLDVRVQLNEDTGMGVDVSVAITNVDEGNAGFVVIPNGNISNADITAATAVAGDVLRVVLSSRDPDGTGSAFTYQWYRDGVDIAGATGASYTITEDYDGNSIYVVVRYTDGGGADETVTVSGIIAPVPTATVLDLADLDSTAGFRLVGEKHRDFSGQEVSSVGDINDDGYDDFAIGAYAADPSGEHSGATYVVFGKASGFSSTIELSELDGSDGFRIDGESPHDTSGGSISAGDVNDDGYNDIIIGADWAEPGNLGRHHNNGSTYVVFGKASGFSDTIDLSDIVRLGGGVRIDGENEGDYSGRSVSSGDVNDDGYDDIIIGAERTDPNGYSSGSTYVVFGKANGPNGLNGIMELSELDGSDGFRIDGANRADYSGGSVSAGDINGDGYDDVIIGADTAAPNGVASGATYVVFGKASGFSRTMELSELDGSDGFRIDGENSYNYSGKSVSSAGDINGDTYDDIIISAPYVDLNGHNSGVTYVVFGKASGFSRTMELSELDGSDGFRINGENARDYSGVSVSSAGDFNGDGYDDIIIGAPGAASRGSYTGSSYVVFGKANGFSRTIELSELDASAGFRIDGENFYDHSGISVSSAGDVNDDGYDDIIIGANYGGRAEGHSYVIYGHATSVTDVDEGNASFVVTSDGDLNAAVAGDVLTVGLISSDPDGDGTFTYQWYRDGVDIAGATGASYTITEADGGNSLYVAVRYTDGGGTDETVTASGIIVPIPANRAPVFENEPTDLSINENADGSAVPVSVGRVVASDADAADTLTYSIVSTADQNGDIVTGFEVDGAGLITYVGTGLNAETITSVALTVSASDGEDSAQTSVAISVTNIDEGNASFVVTSDRDINAAVAGDVLTVALRSSDPDGDGTFTYQWYRDGVDIADATGTSYTITEADGGNSIYVAVRYTDGSGADETVTASGIIVPVPADNDDDASEDPVNITYTMTQASTGVSITRGGVALSVGETFTYQDVQGGWVALTVNDENALSGLRLTTDDGTDADPEGISLDIEVREVADIAAPEAGNDLDYSENEGSLVIDTGDYGDQITAAQGSDFITGGLGDDTINLDPVEGRETGQDTVVYNFGSGSVFTATDGGDDITGFKRGEDIFLLKTESDNPELATLDGLFSYVSGPNKGSSHDDLMIVRPNYEYEPDGDGGYIFFLTGITLHFEDAGVYGNGYLAQGHVSITFDERLPWEEFLSLIEIDNGNGSIDGNFDHRRGIIRDLSTLPNLMGEGSLAYEVEAPAQTPLQDVDVVPLEDDIPATSFDVV